MKRSLSLLLLVLSIAVHALAAEVTGNWRVTLTETRPDGTTRAESATASLKQSGGVVTGTLMPPNNQEMPIEGTIAENKVTLKIAGQSGRLTVLNLTLDGDRMAGTAERGDNRAAVEFIRVLPAR
jgi:hypothetical protein